ncbi:MAG: MerR family transcriptional regulator [Gammaproteobacteria bacterium]|nr:MerR family transcriptional regulator [Gammaproteobacteria bacterium]
MKIGEVAEALDTSVQTLRLYENNGLIKSRRTPLGTRYYNDEELRRLRAIRSFNELGVHYHELKKIADTRLDSQTGHQASEGLRAQLKQLKQQFQSMNEMLVHNLKEIDKSLALLEQCAGCKKSPRRKICERCEVSQGIDQVDLLQLIWDQKDGQLK